MASQRPEAPPAALAGTPASRSRLLLVEDDPSIRRFVGMALEDLAVEVVEAGTLAEARLALASSDFTVLLTDLMLPDGHGLSLFGPSPAAGPRTRPRVVVFSAGIAPATRQRALALGAWRVLDKPVPLATLSACVEEALDEAAAQGRLAAVPTPAPATSTPPVQDKPPGGAPATLSPLWDDLRKAVLAQG